MLQTNKQPTKQLPNIEPIQISSIICWTGRNWKSGVWQGEAFKHFCQNGQNSLKQGQGNQCQTP